MIVKIVSGGQTGVDRGCLDAAIKCEIPHGGWCPKGRKAEDGLVPPEYKLTELSSADYLARTKANVIDSDATLIFSYGLPTAGALKTLTYARQLKKPYHEIDLKITTHTKAVEEIVQWLEGEKHRNDHEVSTAQPPSNCVLNVAGSRESHAPGIQIAVWRILVDVLVQVNPACKKFYHSRESTGIKLKPLMPWLIIFAALGIFMVLFGFAIPWYQDWPRARGLFIF